MDELKKLVGCGDKWFEERALMVLELADALQKGDVSQSEYKELVEDMVRTDSISDEGQQIEFRSMLVAGAYGILQII